MIQDVVDDDEALAWKQNLSEYVQTNPVNGKYSYMYPASSTQSMTQVFPKMTSNSFSYSTYTRDDLCIHALIFRFSSWTKPQVLARAHPNVLAASVWLNKLYHAPPGSADEKLEVDLEAPLSYADRFRMRHPGVQWNAHPPHVDGAYIICVCMLVAVFTARYRRWLH